MATYWRALVAFAPDIPLRQEAGGQRSPGDELPTAVFKSAGPALYSQCGYSAGEERRLPLNSAAAGLGGSGNGRGGDAAVALGVVL